MQNESLKRLVVQSLAWIIGGHASVQILRLVKNLVLTRLLFPEAFGLMSLVWMVMYGLEMLSDMGLGPAIVRDKRGDDPLFLNTIWTMQAVRGVVLFIAAYVASAPVAELYGQQELELLIAVAGLTAVISGLNSTAVHTSRRRLNYKKLVPLELVTEAVSFAVIVVWAWIEPTVWALVGGALVGRVFFMLASHIWLSPTGNQLCWDAVSAKIVVRFAKWIFLGSLLNFLAVQGDRMLLGRLLSLAELGLYSIAIALADAIHALVLRLNQGVVFPAYGKTVQQEQHRLPDIYRRTRLLTDALLLFPIGVLLVLGEWVVAVLYDPRYHGAGWMFQVLCVRLAISSTALSGEACLVALGYTRYSFLLNLSRACAILAGIPLGWHVFGIHGVIWAVALSELAVAGVIWTGLRRHRLLSLRCEGRSVAFTCAGLLAGYAVSAAI